MKHFAYDIVEEISSNRGTSNEINNVQTAILEELINAVEQSYFESCQMENACNYKIAKLRNRRRRRRKTKRKKQSEKVKSNANNTVKKENEGRGR